MQHLKRQVLNDYIRMMIINVPLGLIIGLSIVVIHEIYAILTELYEHYVHINEIFIIISPIVAIFSAYFLVTKLSGSEITGGGSHRLLEVYHYEGGKMSLKSTLIEPLASAITIGLGGSAGFEGPSLLLGGGIGSVIGQKLKLNTDELSTILICGAAAGVSAIFKAPLTGIMFALEIPYQKDIYREAFIPATLSSASSYLVAVSLMGGERIFPLLPEIELSSMLSLHSLIVGVMAGVLSIFFVALNEMVHKLKTKSKLNNIIIALIGGLSIGALTYLYSNIAGTGYETLRELIGGDLHEPLMWVIGLLLIKIIATVITLNTGGSGGVFVPALFAGAALGQVYTMVVPNEGGPAVIVAAMAAMIAASNKTLLTSVALVAETTGPTSVAYTLLASVTSYFISGNISFYGHVQPEKELLEEEEGLHMMYHKIEKISPELLKEVKVKELMRKDTLRLSPMISPREALELVSGYPFSVYPVVSDGKLLGSLSLEDILYQFENNEPLIKVAVTRPLAIEIDQNLMTLVNSLQEGEFDCIFVIENKTKEYRGFISETDINQELLKLLKTVL